MKILMPYCTRSGITIDNSRILGGLEKFAQNIYKNIDAEIIPLHYTEEDRKRHLVTNMVVQEAMKQNVDFILSNYENETLTLNVQARLPEIPIMWISHSCAGGIGRIGQMESMREFVENGGTLFMMSENQYNGLEKASRRIHGKGIILNGGYINSAFCTGDEAPSEIEYDAVTIGRLNKEKQPFWIHRRGYKHKKRTLVMTSNVEEFMTDIAKDYYSKHLHWVYPQETLYNLSHAENMSYLAKGACYVSTHPRESWGITALEALSHGIPLFLKCDMTGIHSSECIPASPDHYKKAIASQVDADIFADICDHFKSYSMDQRHEISGMTKEKHTREKWKSSIMNAIDKTIENHKKHTRTSLMDFIT
ncbi:MAG: glycosyltransferase [Anaerolineaceae bacterium]